MNTPRSPLILVANNPFGHHLLTSQLLETYQDLDLGVEIILLCNGVMHNASAVPVPGLEVVSFAARRGGIASYFNLFFRLLQARWKHPRAVYHLRGFVAGTTFWLSRMCLLGSARYIYDPRGAFFIEWREAGRSKAVGRLLGWIESRLIGAALTTVVTSRRFARLYARLFGNAGKYVTIYNATSFAFEANRKSRPDGENLRIVYLGTFNHWHDMDEVFRVMDSAARQFGPERTEISIYTLARFHDAVRKKFSRIDCAALDVDYVNYERIPDALANKHVGVSVVRPALSSRIASPIKVADYVALGLVPLMNKGIGDFDAHFRREHSAILYKFGEHVDVSGYGGMSTGANKAIYDLVSRSQAQARLAPIVERLCNG